MTGELGVLHAGRQKRHLLEHLESVFPLDPRSQCLHIPTLQHDGPPKNQCIEVCTSVEATSVGLHLSTVTDPEAWLVPTNTG